MNTNYRFIILNYKNQVFLWSLVNLLRIAMNLLKIANIIF